MMNSRYQNCNFVESLYLDKMEFTARKIEEQQSNAQL